ncbi:MAG: hypothetical protein QW039_01695 [Fervidicoccaceae archaeon]
MVRKTLKEFTDVKSEEDECCREVLKKLEEIEQSIFAIEKRLEGLEGTIKEMKSPFSSKITDEMDEALKLLKERGFVRESVDLAKTKQGRRISERLRALGAIELKGSSETYLIHPRKFEELLKQIESIDESDPILASEKMKELRDLFLEMQRTGVIYFDAKERRWKLIS